MNREIPGFYYDSVKRRYFRIEKSQTAPSQAEWSAQNVKRRAAEQAEEEKRRAKLRRDARRVKRARVAAVPLMGGLLARETGASPRRRDGVKVGSHDEVVARAWAGGLEEKGEVRLWPNTPGDRGMISAMWVGDGGAAHDEDDDDNDDDGLGIVCGAADRLWPTASFIPRDADDRRINFQFAAERHPNLSFLPRTFNMSPLHCRITAIKCHEPSSSILFAYEPHHGRAKIGQLRIRGRGAGVNLVQLLRGASGGPDPRSASFGGGGGGGGGGDRSAFVMYALQPAPPSSRLTCIAGTDRGLAQLHDDTLTLLAPPPPRPPNRGPKHIRTPHPDLAPWQGDVLSVDFLRPNPAETVLAGTRSGRVCLLDLRVPPREWSAGSNTFRHPSSAAHVRSVGPYQVLVAGPRDAMALYDVRFLRQQQHQQHQQQQQQQEEHDSPRARRAHQYPRQEGNDNATLPLFTFPGYRNTAHIHVGLDVLTEPGYGGGIVAAAHATDRGDGGTVALYSLRDGSRIPAGAVDAVRAPGVVQALQWQTLPGDRHPSLFVAEGLVVRKYSFWA